MFVFSEHLKNEQNKLCISCCKTFVIPFCVCVKQDKISKTPQRFAIITKAAHII